MRTVFIRFIVIGIIVQNICSTISCIHAGQHSHSKRSDVNNGGKRGSILIPIYDNNESSNEARERTSVEVNDFLPRVSIKAKRNLQDVPSRIFLRKDMLDLDNLKRTPKSPAEESYIRMKSVAKPKDIYTKPLMEVRRIQQDKRSTDSDDPIAVGFRSNKSRKTRQKNYACYCHEPHCQDKNCRKQNRKADDSWKQKIFPNVKEYVDEEYDTSGEETTGTYRNKFKDKIVAAANAPMKFSIPFANNVNFDQRVIVGGRSHSGKKPEKIGLFYQNPHIVIPPAQTNPVYPYNNYKISHPGVIYEAVPIRPNKGNLAVVNSDNPNPFGNNFLNIDECINMYGRTVCAISASAKSTTSKIETIDTSNDKTYTTEEERKIKYASNYDTEENPINQNNGNSDTRHPKFRYFNDLQRVTPLPEATIPINEYTQAQTNFENINLPTASSQSTNNVVVQNSGYSYTTDMHLVSNNDATMPMHINPENFKLLANRPIQAQDYYEEKKIAHQDPSYTYLIEPNDLAINPNVVLHLNGQQYKGYNKNYQNSITDFGQQYSTGNFDIDKNGQNEPLRHSVNFINNNEATNQFNIQENNNLALNVDKSPYTETPQNKTPNPEKENLKFQVNQSSLKHLERKVSSINKTEYEASAQNINSQIPAMILKAHEHINRPPKLHETEALNFTVIKETNITDSPDSVTEMISVKDGNHPDNALQSVTTLEDVETNEYKKYFNDNKKLNLRKLNKLNLRQTEDIKSDNETIGTKLQVDEKIKFKSVGTEIKDDHKDKFVKGLGKVILENEDLTNLTQENHLDGNINKPNYEQTEHAVTENSMKTKQSKNYKNLTSTKSETTQSLIQSVDDRPSASYEQTSEETSFNYSPESSIADEHIALVQSAVKKVINNFVPGRAQDLLANYGEKNSTDFIGANAEELLPEIQSIPILRNLFSLPEVENMIADTAGDLLTRITGLPMIQRIPHLIKNTLHSVIDQIPRPHPTIAPETDINASIEEHGLVHEQWGVKTIPQYETDPNLESSREIAQKIESMLTRSKLEDKIAAHPIVQNLIVKAVKYTLDKERGIVDESTIRRTFDTMIKSKMQNRLKVAPVMGMIPTKMEPLITQPKTPTLMDNNKLAPIIPVTEHVLPGGSWSESQKNLTGQQPTEGDIIDKEKKKQLQKNLEQQKSIAVTKSKNESASFSAEEKSSSVYDEEKGKLLLEKLNVQHVSKAKSDNESVVYETKQSQKSNGPNNKDEPEKNKIVVTNSVISNENLDNERSEYIELSTENKDQSIERNPIKYFSPKDRILEYVKNHPSTDSSRSNTFNEIIGIAKDGNAVTTTRQVKFDSSEIITSPSTENQNRNEPLAVLSSFSGDRESTVGDPQNQKIGNNRMKLLLEVTESPIRSKQGTEATRQANFNSKDTSKNSKYMGKLVPLDYNKDTQTENVNDLQQSKLMYVGDGVRLPLTVKRDPDGSFVLALSDEACKTHQNKDCPCCLPNDEKGVVMREIRSRESKEIEISDDGFSTSNGDSNSNLGRVRRCSEESKTKLRDYSLKSPKTRKNQMNRMNKFINTVHNVNDAPKKSRPTAFLNAFGQLTKAQRAQATSVNIINQSTIAESHGSKKDARATAPWDINYPKNINYPNYRSLLSANEADYGIFGSLINGLKRTTTEYPLSGAPYRYQRRAEGNLRTNIAKQVLQVMHEIALNARQNKSR